MFELLTPLVDGNNAARRGVDRLHAATRARAAGTDPEIWTRRPATRRSPARCAARSGTGSGLQAPTASRSGRRAQPGFNPIAQRSDEHASFLPGRGCNPDVAGAAPVQLLRRAVPAVHRDPADRRRRDLRAVNRHAERRDVAARDRLVTGTPAMTRRYRVETKPIGFGIAPPGDARRSRTSRTPAARSTSPASTRASTPPNEAELQLAISRDPRRRDQDRDLQQPRRRLRHARSTRTSPARAARATTASSACAARPGRSCAAPTARACTCNAPAGPAPGTEICNNLDDDCDGKIDEGADRLHVRAAGRARATASTTTATALIDEDLPRGRAATGACQRHRDVHRRATFVAAAPAPAAGHRDLQRPRRRLRRHPRRLHAGVLEPVGGAAGRPADDPAQQPAATRANSADPGEHLPPRQPDVPARTSGRRTRSGRALGEAGAADRGLQRPRRRLRRPDRRGHRRRRLLERLRRRHHRVRRTALISATRRRSGDRRHVQRHRRRLRRHDRRGLTCRSTAGMCGSRRLVVQRRLEQCIERLPMVCVGTPVGAGELQLHRRQLQRPGRRGRAVRRRVGVHRTASARSRARRRVPVPARQDLRQATTSASPTRASA